MICPMLGFFCTITVLDHKHFSSRVNVKAFARHGTIIQHQKALNIIPFLQGNNSTICYQG